MLICKHHFWALPYRIQNLPKEKYVMNILLLAIWIHLLLYVFFVIHTCVFFFFRIPKMSAARQLQLAKRENFFSDPLFKDIWSSEDNDLQKRLELFKNKSALAVPGKNEAAHNLQVSCSNDKFMVQLELPGFNPEDFSLKTKDNVIVLEAVHEGKSDGESTSR